MSYAENYSNVAQANFSTVKDLQTAEGFVDTYHKETNRKPDEFFYWVGQDGIIDPGTNMYLHDIHMPEKHYIPYLGIIEFDVIKQFDRLSKLNNGYLIWDSPMYKVPGGYPSHKFEVMKITTSASGNKKVENTVIVFDCNNDTALQLAKDLFPQEFGNTKNIEDVRQLVLYRDQNFDINVVIQKISEYLPKDENYIPMKAEDRHYIATLILEHRDSEFIAREMMNRNILGKHSITCPPGVRSSFSESSTNNSNVIDMRRESDGICKKCGTTQDVACGWCKICWELFGDK